MPYAFGAILETVCGSGMGGVVVLLRVDLIEDVTVPFGIHEVGKDSRETAWHTLLLGKKWSH